MAVDMYINMDPIKGESTDEAHTDWIEMLNYSHSVTNTAIMGSASGAFRNGKVSFETFTFTKVMDKASAGLNQFCCDSTKHIPEVVVELCITSEPFMTYTLEDVVVSSVSTGASEGDPTKPIETVSLAFGKFTWKYTARKHDGTSDGDFEKSWDLRTNKGA